MTAYVYDVIRATLPTMTLDQSFEAKEEISLSLKTHLQEVMSSYGFIILQALVTDLLPASVVRDAMNEINASKRMKEAANQKAEGEKVLKVKRAEAESESMYLSGVGVARQRTAIMEGLQESVVQFSSEVKGANAKDVMDLLILNQYFDTIQVIRSSLYTPYILEYTLGRQYLLHFTRYNVQDIGRNVNTKVVFLPNDGNSMRNGMLEAKA